MNVTFNEKSQYWKSKEVSMDSYDEVKKEALKDYHSSSMECLKEA